MENFLRSLSFSSNTSADDVTYPCMKIMDWIYKVSTSNSHPFSYKDVENIGKGIVYLNTCYKLFGEELDSQLLQQYPFFAKQVKTFFGNTPKKHYNITEQILEKIARTEDGLEHIYNLESILSNTNEFNEIPISLQYSSKVMVSKTPTSKSKMYVLLQRVFQLPRDQVDIALDRILNSIPFSVVGWVFCEPEKSCFSDGIEIFAHKIYEKLNDGSISPLFLKSVYISSSASQIGLEFYYSCLKNTCFRKGMSSFFMRALIHLSETGFDFNDHVKQLLFEKHRTNHIFYLIWAALSRSSPCRSELHKQLMESNLSKFLYVLNKFERIYD